LGGAHRDHRVMAATLKQALSRATQRLSAMPIPALLERRYEKFRRMGVYEELAIEAAKAAGGEGDSKDSSSGETWKENGSH
jgi:acetyl-CoA carboxylase carboxyl transferase subunit alpha